MRPLRLSVAESDTRKFVTTVNQIIERMNLAGATAERPGNVPEGWQFYDTTLNRPIWWDGAAWRYADGTAA